MRELATYGLASRDPCGTLRRRGFQHHPTVHHHHATPLRARQRGAAFAPRLCSIPGLGARYGMTVIAMATLGSLRL